MTDVTFDQQHNVRIGFGEGTDTPVSAKPAALRHKPSSRTQLICRWHRSAQGPLTCVWTEAPSTPLDARDVQLLDLPDKYGFACPPPPESRLQPVSGWIAMAVLLASAALGEFMYFVTELSDLL
jgi:hypothetical protein